MQTRTRPSEYLAPQEVARELRVHVSAIYRAVERGDLPAVRLNEHGRSGSRAAPSTPRRRTNHESLKNIVQHPYLPAWGAQVAPHAEGAPAPSILPAETAFLLDWAGTHWPQADPGDFEFDGMNARHLETDTTYQLRVGMPIRGETASGISTLCVRDGRLVLLADKADRVTSHHAADFSYEAGKVSYAGPPLEGQIL
jgi:excisionase family DNA binding protein